MGNSLHTRWRSKTSWFFAHPLEQMMKKLLWPILALFMISNTVLATEPRAGLTYIAPGVAYNPRNFSLAQHSAPTTHQILQDLRLLKSAGMKGLVTYSAAGTLGSIPALARKVGFDGTIIMGIWNPQDHEEWQQALTQRDYVDGYCLGNEGLGIRYQPEKLAEKMAQLRTLTRRPVTTSEPIDNYIKGPYRAWLLAHSDWLFPTAHPFWSAQAKSSQAVNWIVARYDFLVATSGHLVILKEAGFPSAGVPGANEKTQLRFFQALASSHIPFFYFEAYDQLWKPTALQRGEVEAHWGLYRSDGTPKKVALWFINRNAAP